MTEQGQPSEVLDVLTRWAAAEAANDAGHLAEVLADDFVGVGPAGFVLTRDQWLVRFDNGLTNQAFAVVEPQHVRDLGTAAVVVAVLDQQTSFGGQDNSGRFRLTLVVVRQADRWLLANVHIGPLQPPPVPPAI